MEINWQEKINDLTSRKNSSTDEDHRRAQEEYDRYQKEQEKARLDTRYRICDISGRHRFNTFDRYQITEENRHAYETVKAYAEGFKAGVTASGLYLAGSYGVGKTFLAAALCNYLIENNICYCRLETMSSIGTSLRATFNSASSEKNILKDYCKTALLAIDDLGKEKATPYNMEKLYYIIDERYNNYLPTVITSNYGIKGLAERLTIDGNDDVVSSILSRLNETCKGIFVKGEDWRTTHRLEKAPEEIGEANESKVILK